MNKDELLNKIEWLREALDDFELYIEEDKIDKYKNYLDEFNSIFHDFYDEICYPIQTEIYRL